MAAAAFCAAGIVASAWTGFTPAIFCVMILGLLGQMCLLVWLISGWKSPHPWVKATNRVVLQAMIVIAVSYAAMMLSFRTIVPRNVRESIRRGDDVVAAIDRFAARMGDLPSNLSELEPLPRPAFSWANPEGFSFSVQDGKYSLSFSDGDPIDAWRYHAATKSWRKD